MNAIVKQDLGDRRTYIGGTDIGAILGVHPYKTAVDVWMEKAGRAAPIDETPAMRRGKKLERAVLDWYEEDTGRTLVRMPAPAIADDILRGNLDAFVKDDRVVDAKTVSPYVAKRWGEPGTDEVPVEYAAQMHWYMGLIRLPIADLAALIGDELQIYPIAFDDQLFGAMREQALKFWRDYVINDVPPPARSAHDAVLIWPQSQAKLIEASESVVVSINRAKEIKSAIKSLETELEDLDNVIRPAFGDADTLTVLGAPVATYKTQVSKRFNQKEFQQIHPSLFEQFKSASTSRVLRLK